MPDIYGVFGSGLVAFLATAALISLLSPVARRLGLVDFTGGRKRHQGSVPLIGGIAIYLGFTSSMVALTPPWEPLGCIMAGGLLMVCVGMLDDYFAISRGARIAAQMGAALLAIYGADVRLYDLGNLSLTGGMLTLGMLSVPFTVLSIGGVTNALNLIDGTDGLAGTLTVLALLALMVMAGLAGRNELLQVSICLAGAVSAFLAFNLPSAQPRRGRVFLGDAGSTLLGYLLACLLIASSQGENRVFAPVIALWLLAVPLQDTVAVMVHRLASVRSPLHADRTHLHHLALSAGLSQQRTLLLISGTGVLYITIGLAGWFFGVSALALLGVFLAACFYYLWWSHRAWTTRRFLGRVVCRRLEGVDSRRSRKDRRQVTTWYNFPDGLPERRRGDRRVCTDRRGTACQGWTSAPHARAPLKAAR